MIRITSKKEGFRRCGVAHSKTAVDWPDDRFSEEDLATLKAEPMLQVVEIQEENKSLSDEIEAMTVAQLTAEIARYQPVSSLKGLKKAELFEILKAHVTSPIAPKE